MEQLCAGTIKKENVSLDRHAQNIIKMKSAELKDVTPMHAKKDIQEALDFSEKTDFVSFVRVVHMCMVRLSRGLRLIYKKKGKIKLKLVFKKYGEITGRHKERRESRYEDYK